MSNKEKINFFIPLELVKGQDGEVGEMKIKGICSTVAEDTDGETLLPSGFDFQPLLEKGFLNWNHQSNKNPSAIIGRPTRAEIVNDGNAFYIEGVLYKGSPEARSVFQLAQVLESEDPTRRLGFSIEGQALDRDPINDKIIRKARITGVAITPCPKNPNTLLSLMKGEYSEPFVEEEEEDEEETKKAMSVEGEVGKTLPESVEGAPKDLERLQKSEVYETIIDSLETYDEEIIKSTYSLIEQFGTNENQETMITKDTVQKALAFLHSIEKGESPEGLDKEENKEEVEENKEVTTTEEEVTSKEEEGEGVAEVGIEEDAKEFLDKGHDGDCIVEELIKKGYSLKESVCTVQQLISDYKVVGNGGKVSEFSSTSFNKGEIVEILEGFDKTSEVQNIIKGEVSGILETTNNKFKSFGVLLKAQSEESQELKDLVKSLSEQNSEILKSNQDLVQAFQGIRNTRTPARSFVSQTQVDRFQKSEAPTGDSYNLSDKLQKGELVDRLFNEYSNIKARGGEDKQLANTIQSIETTGSVSEQDLLKLQSLNIQVYN